jgi:hypothetical protein
MGKSHLRHKLAKPQIGLFGGAKPRSVGVAYSPFLSGLATVMTVPQRSHRWTMLFPAMVVCIATWQIGQGRGGWGFDWLIVAASNAVPPQASQLRMFT